MFNEPIYTGILISCTSVWQTYIQIFLIYYKNYSKDSFSNISSKSYSMEEFLIKRKKRKKKLFFIFQKKIKPSLLEFENELSLN